MNLKTISLIILISVFIGIGLFFWIRKTQSQSKAVIVPVNNQTGTDKPAELPSPLPSQPPIDKDSDLQMEISKLKIPDFSTDYTSLKEEVNSSF